MNTKQVILHRSSTRGYLDRPVSDNILRQIIKTAQKSPSWINAQENRVVIAEGSLLNKMRKTHQIINDDPNQHTNSDVKYTPIRKWDSASQRNMEAKINHNKEQFGKVTATKMTQQHKDKLFNVPAVAYLILPKGYTDYSLLDTGILAQTIMLAAGDLGVASLPAFEFVKYPDHLRRFLKLSDQTRLILGIGLGYRDAKDPINQIHPTRMPLDHFLQIKR